MKATGVSKRLFAKADRFSNYLIGKQKATKVTLCAATKFAATMCSDTIGTRDNRGRVVDVFTMFTMLRSTGKTNMNISQFDYKTWTRKQIL
jgi:hypothetical protein